VHATGKLFDNVQAVRAWSWLSGPVCVAGCKERYSMCGSAFARLAIELHFGHDSHWHTDEFRWSMRRSCHWDQANAHSSLCSGCCRSLLLAAYVPFGSTPRCLFRVACWTAFAGAPLMFTGV
jgi:hypothetical protein